MSSMRNAVQRRNHKERAQPTERKRWGLLEKHKDYSLRAADHNAKKRKIKSLQQKASERNEDEFYFAMMSSTTAGGVKQTRRGEENSGGGGKALSQGVVRLMKTQDEGYLRTTLQGTKRKRERVEREVLVSEVGAAGGVATAAGLGKKVVFGEDGEEVAAVPVSAFGDDDSDLDMDGFVSEDESVATEEEKEDKGLSKADLAARRRKRHVVTAKRRQLEALRDREVQLGVALREVEAQRARMSGTVGGVNKNGVKWKARPRKR
ncbi:hypothetical protein B0A55_04169 [Friedmanniomyces simplex]|uniref:U3 small nucleolar RNA-associated protein 11 n=1 Tax=Friedmanniomyces simplex TaxID=329884 RepID=A0A4V5NHD3_9PEZI|nr:hypothetical protein B0A55_04169 [Friedmanniomyces simplex]